MNNTFFLEYCKALAKTDPSSQAPQLLLILANKMLQFHAVLGLEISHEDRAF